MGLLSTAQAAQRLGITRRGVVHRIQAGTLVAIKIGEGKTSGWAIDEEEVERVLEESE